MTVPPPNSRVFNLMVFVGYTNGVTGSKVVENRGESKVRVGKKRKKGRGKHLRAPAVLISRNGPRELCAVSGQRYKCSFEWTESCKEISKEYNIDVIADMQIDILLFALYHLIEILVHPLGTF